MSKTAAITHIEQQIESLHPVDQLKMLERILRHLKRLLVQHTADTTQQSERKGIAEKLNQVYDSKPSGINSQLFNAQLVSISRDEW